MDTRLTTCEAAAVAGVGRGTILRWIKLGYLGDVNKQNVTRGVNCGYKIEISALNKYLYRRYFGRKPNEPFNILLKDVSVESGMDEKTLRSTRRKLQKAIDRAQAALDKIEALL